MKFQIKNRWTGAVQFECELSAEVAGLSYGLQLGFAVKQALVSGSDLSRSDLRGSNLRGSDLRGSNLRGSDLSLIRADFYGVLAWAPHEVPALIDALKAGKVDGSTYTGECACLVGTIAHVRGVDYQSLECNASRPIERFFTAIHKGDTPENSQPCAIAVEWAESWLATMREAFGPARAA
jgi:uncharacterized protein YjbI with pentapeptide repeats